jgi:hypothetical protein
MSETIDKTSKEEIKPNLQNPEDDWKESLQIGLPEFNKIQVRIFIYSFSICIILLLITFILYHYFVNPNGLRDPRLGLMGLLIGFIGGMILVFGIRKPNTRYWCGVIKHMEQKGYKIERKRVGLRQHLTIHLLRVRRN